MKLTIALILLASSIISIMSYFIAGFEFCLFISFISLVVNILTIPFILVRHTVKSDSL